MLDCRIRISLRLCNCVLPFYSTTKGAKELVYCSVAHLPCLVKHQGNLTNVKECARCELSCQNIVYEVDKLSRSDVDADGNGDGPYLNIEWLTWPIIRYKKEVLFGWVDLLGEEF